MYLEIQAQDLPRAAAFYRAVLGWDIERVDEDLPVEYWRIHGEGLAGGLLPRPAPAPEPQQGTNAFVVSFGVEDLGVVSATVEEHGGQVALPAFPVPGMGWQAYFLDTEGNTFGVFQADETAG